jgi:CBS domain-containing protein
MINRSISAIIKDQNPLILSTGDSVQRACEAMRERRAGSVLVVDDQHRLAGIFTGRDAVRVLAQGKSAASTLLAEAMTAHPVTIAPESRAIDALRSMCDGGFRHVPVVDNGRIWGVVSRNDFKGLEIDRLEEEEHLWECIR